jgi:hypothetical protein
MAKEFTAGGFFSRWLFALVLVLGTYNPTGYSWVGWFLEKETPFEPAVVLAGIVLLIGWVIYLRATFMSLGLIGVILGAALFSALMWLLIDLGWLSLESTDMLTWIVLVVLSLILAAGLSWSHIRRRLSGQFDVDDREG